MAAILITALVFASGGYVQGFKKAENLERALREQFTDNIPANQGQLAGWVISHTGNETLIEAWEELTSDIIREYIVN